MSFTGYNEVSEAALDNLANGPERIAFIKFDRNLSELLGRLANYPRNNSFGILVIELTAFSIASLRSAQFLSKAGFAGQVAPVLRQSLEAIAYALLFANSKEYAQAWLDREIDSGQKQKILGIDRKIGTFLKIKNENLFNLWRHSKRWLRLGQFLRAIHIRSEVQHGNLQGSLLIAETFLDGDWFYGLLTATKT